MKFVLSWHNEERESGNMILKVEKQLPAYTIVQRRNIKMLNAVLDEPDFHHGNRGYWRGEDGRCAYSFARDLYGYFIPESCISLSGESLS